MIIKKQRKSKYLQANDVVTLTTKSSSPPILLRTLPNTPFLVTRLDSTKPSLFAAPIPKSTPHNPSQLIIIRNFFHKIT
ncbi:hypothetical protein HanRHA438_Chr13g0598311 [Helianthus annuus]|nr:hypothetical protein HanRHA438_Chr13g0598311 [Helianthus annuus]